MAKIMPLRWGFVCVRMAFDGGFGKLVGEGLLGWECFRLGQQRWVVFLNQEDKKK